MKKNTMLRIASVLLVAVMMTTCAISGTFAKYVTSGTSQDEARVAKWGVEVTGYADMFKTEYDKNDAGFTLSAKSVVSSDTDKLLAPGTAGKLTEVALSGTPEVAVRVTYDATVDLAGWNIGGAVYYCPVVVEVEGTAMYGMNYANEAAFEAAIKAAIEALTKDYVAKTDLSTVGTNAPSVSWAWAFEKNDEVLGVVCDKNSDEYDTALGDQAADGSAATISVEIVTTVTQID